jgi:kynurenine formamidase
MTLERRHGDMSRADGSSAANDLIVLGSHVGTHIDALCHVSHLGRLYGGEDAMAAQAGGRFGVLGAETIGPIVRGGVLLDVAQALGLEVCGAGEEITPAQLEMAAEKEGVEIRPGSVILVRTGWGRHFDDKDRYLGLASGVPGPGEAGARWLAGFSPFAVGSDTIAFEQIAAGAGHRLLPAHRVLLVEEGIHIIETLDLEALAASEVWSFTFVCLPLKLVGATGSPVRPVAIAPRGGSVRT